MKSKIISTTAICLLSTLPNLVFASFEMAFDNYLYGEGRAPQYRAYDDQGCNRIPPITTDPRVIISIALRTTTVGLNTGYNTRPPPAIAFYFNPNPTGPGPHCIDSQLVMIGRYHDFADSQEFFFTPLPDITHFRVVDDEESYAWRMWDENVDGTNGDIGRIGTVVYATGEGWRTSVRNDIMVRDLEFDWTPVIRGGRDWVSSSGDSGVEEEEEEGEGEEEVVSEGGVSDSSSDPLALRRIPPRLNPVPEIEDVGGEDSLGFSPLRASRQSALGMDLDLLAFDGYDNLDQVDQFQSPPPLPQVDEEFGNPTEEEEVDRQERYHTERVFQLADLQQQQRRRAMMEPITDLERIVRVRNQQIDGGNYTPIPPSQRHRSYGDLVQSGWFIDSERELRARWQEYMTIAFLRFKERHGIGAEVSADRLTQRQRDLFVDFLRRDGTPMFFQETYMRPIINSHAQQQLINSFGPPPPSAVFQPDEQVADVRPNPFLRFDNDFEDAVQNGGSRQANQRNSNGRTLAAQQRYNQRMEQLRRQNEMANQRGFRINMVRDPQAAQVADLRRRRQQQQQQQRQFEGIPLNGFENPAGARSRIMRNQPGRRGGRGGPNRNLEDEIDAWDIIAAQDDDYEAGWNVPDLDLGRVAPGNDEPPAPVIAAGGGLQFGPLPAVNNNNNNNRPNWAVLQAPLQIPRMFWSPPPSPSTEPGDNVEDVAEEEEEEEEGIGEGEEGPRFGRFDSDASGSGSSPANE
ncbi:hypothetical protein TWF506_009307 [Arthrobotrys conoides]|uniref:Uncharacterized protein n=1 Tax=Arthrobotrys conoides TaxID=74498 RepID=A0AAN8N4S7_9PEZI